MESYRQAFPEIDFALFLIFCQIIKTSMDNLLKVCVVIDVFSVQTMRKKLIKQALSWGSFQSYVGLSVVTFNLQEIAALI